MKIISSIDGLRHEIDALKAKGLSIGFVPTMGALHAGHISLVSNAVSENQFVVVSVFVNPTQFNNPQDLEKYPRDIERDAKMLESAGCNLIFAPDASEMYTENEINNTFDFDFGGLDSVMEGEFRPGHFNGVVQIVSKLFQLVQPNNAYFGEKDFQQLAIIHRMVDVLKMNVQIIDCPIIREASGLAMSSRNERLTTDQRTKAAEIYKVLINSRNFASEKSPEALKAWVINQINEVDLLQVEYFDIVDATTLKSINSWTTNAVGCVAVFCGEVRLIDNIRYKSVK